MVDQEVARIASEQLTMMARVLSVSQLFLLAGYLVVVWFYRFRDFSLCGRGCRWATVLSATVLPATVYLGFGLVILFDVGLFYSHVPTRAELVWSILRMASRVVFMVAFAVYDIKVHAMMDECAAAKKACKEA